MDNLIRHNSCSGELFIRDVLFGRVIQEVDGYYYFEYGGRGGLIGSHTLRQIADYIDSLNKDWDDKVSQYFKDQETII